MDHKRRASARVIKFDPAAYLRKNAPASKIKKLLKKTGDGISVKKAALDFVDDIDAVSKKSVAEIALKTVASYNDRIADDPDLKDELLKDPKQLIQRVQNTVIFEVHNEIKGKYGGNTATWLPSSADEPRPEHQLNYGKQYIIGEGIDGVEPGDEYGCQCGVEIDTEDSSLEL